MQKKILMLIGGLAFWAGTLWAQNKLLLSLIHISEPTRH
mgnify:CR=1 FL=1